MHMSFLTFTSTKEPDQPVFYEKSTSKQKKNNTLKLQFSFMGYKPTDLFRKKQGKLHHSVCCGSPNMLISFVL